MTKPVKMAELWRGDFLESSHFGHAVVARADGTMIESWGDPGLIVLPRSSCKMVQALALVESGAADAFGLSDRHLALACASHSGAPIHTEEVGAWLGHIGLAECDLRCGCQRPKTNSDFKALISAGLEPTQLHNNCSGKHTGFLTLSQHLKAPSEDYIAPDCAVQKAVRGAFEEVTGMESPGFGIDVCSAPNFVTRLSALARAMAFFADPKSDTSGQAATRLVRAMDAHPLLVSGEGRACARISADLCAGDVVKTGAEGVFVAILSTQGLGVALKIVDGATRAAETAIVSLLVKLGALAQDSASARFYLKRRFPNWCGIEAAFLRPGENFFHL